MASWLNRDAFWFSELSGHLKLIVTFSIVYDA